MKLTTREAPLELFRHAPDLHGMAKRCIRLHPRTADSLPAKSSKMGGAFLHIMAFHEDGSVRLELRRFK